MPRFTRWAARLALLYLLLGFTFGALLLANKGVPFAAWLWRLRPAHIELLLFGWSTQLAFAVAHQLIPRFRGGSFGPEWLAWVALALLNGGLLLVALGPLLGLPGWVSFVGRMLEASAALAFVRYIWPRVRPLGRQAK